MDRQKIVKRYQVDKGRGFRMKDFDADDTWKLKSKEHAEEWLQRGVAHLAELQARLYAQNQWAILLIFQAMDAAGKDGTIKHVMSGINPQGCQVFSFKVPSEEDLNHDFLWRSNRCLPERGRIGIFNRSYYEEVLVVRVHPEWLGRQKLPPALVGKNIWKERFQSINDYERHLSRNGVVVRKFFLHVSRREQQRRLLERLEHPEKNWKFSLADVAERRRWDDYMRAYEETIAETACPDAPWYIVPADHKWFSRLVVAEVVIETMENLKLKYPEVDPAKRKELVEVRRRLEKER